MLHLTIYYRTVDHRNAFCLFYTLHFHKKKYSTQRSAIVWLELSVQHPQMPNMLPIRRSVGTNLCFSFSFFFCLHQLTFRSDEDIAWLPLMCVRHFASNDIFFSFKFDWIKDAYKNTWIFYVHTMTIVRITTTVHTYWLTIHHFAWHVDMMMSMFNSIRRRKSRSAQYLFIGLFCTKINTKKELQTSY